MRPRPHQAEIENPKNHLCQAHNFSLQRATVAFAFALSSQIGDSGLFLAGSLNGKRHERVPAFEPVPRIELGIGS